MLIFFKFVVFFAAILLLIYMLRLVRFTKLRWEFRSSAFKVLIAGISILTAATLLDVFAAIYTPPFNRAVINVLFTIGEVTYISGIILWSNYTIKMIMKYEDIALTDPMTGLFNRNGIEKVYRSFINDGNSFYLMVCDLDGVKKINDNKGHLQGDQYIKKASNILKETFKDNGYTSRIGGDEFVIIFDNMSYDEIQVKSAEVKHLVNKLYPGFNSGLSLGWASCPKDGKMFDELLRIADKNMYRDKENNRSEKLKKESC